jgi:hypothetical protein
MDVAQELECDDCGGTAIEKASWGRIKALFRGR